MTQPPPDYIGIRSSETFQSLGKELEDLTLMEVIELSRDHFFKFGTPQDPYHEQYHCTVVEHPVYGLMNDIINIENVITILSSAGQHSISPSKNRPVFPEDIPAKAANRTLHIVLLSYMQIHHNDAIKAIESTLPNAYIRWGGYNNDEDHMLREYFNKHEPDLSVLMPVFRQYCRGFLTDDNITELCHDVKDLDDLEAKLALQITAFVNTQPERHTFGHYINRHITLGREVNSFLLDSLSLDAAKTILENTKDHFVKRHIMKDNKSEEIHSAVIDSLEAAINATSMDDLLLEFRKIFKHLEESLPAFNSFKNAFNATYSIEYGYDSASAQYFNIPIGRLAKAGVFDGYSIGESDYFLQWLKQEDSIDTACPDTELVRSTEHTNTLFDYVSKLLDQIRNAF